MHYFLLLSVLLSAAQTFKSDSTAFFYGDYKSVRYSPTTLTFSSVDNYPELQINYGSKKLLLKRKDKISQTPIDSKGTYVVLYNATIAPLYDPAFIGLTFSKVGKLLYTMVGWDEYTLIFKIKR